MTDKHLADKQVIESSTPTTDAHLEHLNLPDGRKIGIPDHTVAQMRAFEHALRLAVAWIEEEEGRTVQEIVAIDDRGLARNGTHPWNERFATLCRATYTALGMEPKA